MTLFAWAETSPGLKYSVNQDNHLMYFSAGVFAVSDGMGSRDKSEVASYLSMLTLQKTSTSLKPAFAQIKSDLLVNRGSHSKAQASENEKKIAMIWGQHAFEVFSVINAGLLRAQESNGQERTKGMACTLSMLQFLGPLAFSAHIGDSAIYLLRGSTLVQVTQEHRDPERGYLLRSLGVEETIKSPDVRYFERRPQDRWLLCSDGVTLYLDGPQIAKAMCGAPQQVAASIVKACLDKGGEDNITAIFLMDTEGV